MLPKRYRMGMTLIGLCVLLCVVPQASADGSPSVSPTPPGEVIDKTNWEEVEDLVPHTILNWVKAGKLPGYKIAGSRWYVDPETFDQLAKQA